MLTAHLITHQCVTLDYCFESTIHSMMDLCDDIYINDGSSTDGTLDILYKLQEQYGKDRIKIFARNWLHNRRMWADEKNFLLDKIPKDNYVICIDADEVIHEDDMDLINISIKRGIAVLSFDMIHFYGRPTHYIEGPAWYKQHTRLFHNSLGIRLLHIDKGCADDLVWPDNYPAHMGRNFNPGAKIFHYGNCRDPKALGMKSKKADDLYQYSNEYSNEYSNGNLASPRSFTYDFDNVKTKLFNGIHPKYVKEWVDQHKNQDTFFNANDNNVNKLWCFN